LDAQALRPSTATTITRESQAGLFIFTISDADRPMSPTLVPLHTDPAYMTNNRGPDARLRTSAIIEYRGRR
jgi:hypothetical protein